MRSYAEINDDSTPGPAFSNGTDFVDWQENVCGNGFPHGTGPCLNDKDENCPLIEVAWLESRTPAEWQGPYPMYACSEYRPTVKEDV